jgi:hypothetical protein
MVLSSIRRASAGLLVALLALPPCPAASAVTQGVIQGTVLLEGRPLSGVTVAFIELDSGDVVRAVSGRDGSFEAQAAPGQYAVTTESQAGLTIGSAPVRVAVASGRVASAQVELLAVPSALAQEAPPAGAPQEPVAPVPPASAPSGAPQAPAPPVWVETMGTGADIQFEAVQCFVAGEYPLLDASITPTEEVARARVYFKAAVGEQYYYVEMTQEGGQFLGKLPPPKVVASPITYYIQSTTTEFEESQTREVEAVVVDEESECGDLKVAAFGPAGGVTVFAATTGASIIAPSGFALAAGAGVAIGTVAVIVGGAAAAGIVGGVITNPGGGGGGPTPPPVIINPSPIPTPVPIPTPTPSPITSLSR